MSILIRIPNVNRNRPDLRTHEDHMKPAEDSPLFACLPTAPAFAFAETDGGGAEPIAPASAPTEPALPIRLADLRSTSPG